MTNSNDVLNILKDQEIPRILWNNLIESNPFASPFQTPDFLDLNKSTKGSSAKAIAIANENEILALAIITVQKEAGIKGFFSRRGIIYGGPLLSSKHPEASEKLLQAIITSLKGKVIYLEIRNYFNYEDFNAIFSKAKWKLIPYLNVQLNIHDIRKDTLLSIFKYNRRREIKQSYKQGATTSDCTSISQLKEIFDILEQNYKERVKLPLPKFEFFSNFYQYANMKAFTVKHENTVIGGAFCPVLDLKGLYTYYYCGLRNYNKRIFPSHLAIVAAMEYCIDNNIPHFDFMGAGKPGIEYGVRQYKLEFGGKLVEHGRYLKIMNPLLYRIGKLGIGLISRK